MWFNDIDPTKVHPAISIMYEIAPGSAKRRIDTLKGTDGEIVTGVTMEAGEYTVRMNIAGRTRREAWDVREKIAAWAASSGEQLAKLIPTHKPDRYYNAILSSISDPKFTRGFATVDVIFLVPRPVALSMQRSQAGGMGGMQARIGGSHPARPVLKQTIASGRNGVTWTMDGKTILTMTGTFSAGDEIEMDTLRESLTVNGAYAMHRLDPQRTKWRPGYTTGVHEIKSSDGGRIEMRWRDEWQ